MQIKIAAAVIATALFLGAPIVCAADIAPATIASQLQAMNDADCRYSKNADWGAFEKTLAPEYVGINVDGSKDNLASLVAYFAKPSPDRVTTCTTSVSAVTHVGDRYYLFGVYTEDGFRGEKHVPYHSVSRIRDTWKSVGGRWLQTESLTYEMTISVSGKVVAHYVLPKAAQSHP